MDTQDTASAFDAIAETPVDGEQAREALAAERSVTRAEQHAAEAEAAPEKAPEAQS